MWTHSSCCYSKCSEFGLERFDPVQLLVFGFSDFRVHLLELCGDLQRRLILDLRNVELDEQQAARAEEQEYEEAEAV